MINNPSPEGSGNQWNSDQIALDNLSCRQLAALSTAFLGAFRILNTEKKIGGSHGVLCSMHKLLENHIELMESNDLPENFKKVGDEVTAVSLIAFCLAAISVLEKTHPQHAGTLASTLIKSAIELAKETGPIGSDDVILVDVRVTDKANGDDLSAVELAFRLESSELIDELAATTEMGKLIKRLVEEGENDNPPEGGIHGNN